MDVVGLPTLNPTKAEAPEGEDPIASGKAQPPASSAVSPRRSHKFHILINPLYVIYWANVYYSHWDNDNIKMMVEGCSYKIHYRFDLEGDTYQRLKY